jgi:TonB family protein
MLQFLALVLLAQPGASTVDYAISLYEMGDIPGAILQLEELVKDGTLSLDEQLRAWNRLGSAYYAMGSLDNARFAYSRLLALDVYYDLGPRANPRLRDLLAQVRDESMATAMVRSEPAGALVTLDGDLMGVTPLLVEGLIGGRSYSISVYQVGFETGSRDFIAQPGQNHNLDFSLLAPGTMAASADTTTQTVAVVSPPVGQAEAGGAQGESAEAETSGSQAATPRSTEDLIAALTQGGGGFDMSTLAGSGALQRDSSQEEAVYAGSTSSRNPLELAQSGVPVRAEESVGPVMVFTDVGQLTSQASTGTAAYSSRSAEEVMEVLAGKQDQIRYIYSKHLRTDPLLSGSVEVEMVIQPSGRVTDVAILSSTTYNQAFEMELVRAIGTWRFGSVDENEGPLVLQFPFNFQ